MIVIVITTISIFVITAVAWISSRFLSFRVCPICAGVSGTWLWMLIGMFANQLPAVDYRLPVAILMGGSIVGIAYVLEKHVLRGRSLFFWKAAFIPAGFVVVYGLILSLWAVFFPTAVVLILVLLVFFVRPKREKVEEVNSRIKELEKKMKECC